MKWPRLGAEQEVGVLDALGDALEGEQRAEIVGLARNSSSSASRDFGVDRHLRPQLLRAAGSGRLKTMLSSAVRTSSTVDVEARGESVDHLVDQHLRRRGAGGDADASRHPSKSRPVDLGGALDEHRLRAAGALGHLAQALRVGGVRRADHDHPVDPRRHALHRLLAVGRGVADVFLVRADDLRESARAARRRCRPCRRPTASSA